MPDHSEPEHLRSGRRAEQTAERFLRKQGLKLVTRNYHCRHGEIDLIFRHPGEDILIFTEVRYRQNSRFGSAEETVNYHKQQKLIMAARFFLAEKYRNTLPACRFDVISVTGDNFAVEWIENAFEAG